MPKRSSETSAIVARREERARKAVKVTKKNPANVTKVAAISTLMKNASAEELSEILKINAEILCANEPCLKKLRATLTQFVRLMDEEELREMLENSQSELWVKANKKLDEIERARLRAMNTMKLLWEFKIEIQVVPTTRHPQWRNYKEHERSKIIRIPHLVTKITNAAITMTNSTTKDALIFKFDTPDDVKSSRFYFNCKSGEKEFHFGIHAALGVAVQALSAHSLTNDIVREIATHLTIDDIPDYKSTWNEDDNSEDSEKVVEDSDA